MKGTEAESGYIGKVDVEEFIGSSMTGVEIIRVSGINVLARGRRYGRQWLLKGLVSEVRDSTAMRRRLLKEFEIHSRLSHPGIAQAVGLEDIPEVGLCIIEEWIEGKTLAELLRKGGLSKTERRRTMRSIIQAVGYLHGKGIAHRDLKPSNIMVRDAGGDAVLIDFGLADSGDYVELKQSAGTEGFISPEQMTEGGAHASDDVYSLGVIMRELCPEYAAIAKRCTGSLKQRPEDARALLRALDRRDRRPRRVMTAVVTAAFIAACIIVSWRIMDLIQAASEAEQRAIALGKENARAAAHATQLEDSLQTVSARMQAAETEKRREDEYKAAVARVIQAGYRKADAMLAKYDREVAGLSQDRNQEFSELCLRLQSEFREWVDGFCASDAVAKLKTEDRERMWMEQYNHFTTEYTKYHSRWMKKFYPDFGQEHIGLFRQENSGTKSYGI